jgi:hypothetical protein
MKKNILVILGVLVAILVLVVSVVSFSRQQYPIGNQEYKGVVSSGSATLSGYDLPYPGILPDHPLYFVKMIRDRARLILVRNQVKKVELLLFYADKRMGAAEALLKDSKISLAEITAHKAEMYMGQAMKILLDFNEEEKEHNMDLWWKFYKSISVHKLLLDEMALMVEGDERVNIEKVIRSCEVYREKTMGELKIEESENDEVVDETVSDNLEDEMFDVEKGYL